jgi:hypothetical protein
MHHHAGVHARFWMQPNILMFIWAGVGLDNLLPRFCAHSRVLNSIALLLVAGAVGLQAKLHFAASDLSDAWCGW